MREVRLIVPDGEAVRAAAAVLGNHLGLPVWVTSAGAEVRVENGQLVAERAGGPASWVQVLPGGRPDAVPEILTWYRTERGMIQARQGEAVIETSRDDAGRVNGIILADHLQYNAARGGLFSLVWAGLYGVGVDIAPGDDGPVFLLPDFDGSVARRPLGEFPELLGRYGRADGQPIAILALEDSTRLDGRDPRWKALTENLAGLARAAGASVFFMGRGFGTEPRDGDPAVDGDGWHWWRADPPRGPGEPALPAFLEDPAGPLREPGEVRATSLPTGEGVPGEGVTLPAGGALRAGVVSATDDMMRGQMWGYFGVRGDDGRGVFVVDVPLTEGGHIGLVRYEAGAAAGGRATEGPVRMVELARAEVVAADAGSIMGMIRRAGYQPDRQVIQFLAAPSDDEAHGVFAREALEIAGLIGADVFIVGAAGATVAYDADREAFAARLAGGDPAGWQQLAAGARPASRARAAAGLLRNGRAGDPGPAHRTARQRLYCLGGRGRGQLADAVDDSGWIVPRAIEWPPGSWEAEHGQRILSAVEWHGVLGGFVVGVGADPGGAWLVYDVDDEGFLAEGRAGSSGGAGVAPGPGRCGGGPAPGG